MVLVARGVVCGACSLPGAPKFVPEARATP
jgi:hypothetical protein